MEAFSRQEHLSYLVQPYHNPDHKRRIMLDAFEILTTSGVVLWSKSYVPVGANVVDSLIKDVFIANRTQSRDYRKDKYTLKWLKAKDLGLIFVAVYQSILHLSWVETLLENVKILFTDLYKDQLKELHTSIVDCPFDEYFDRQIQELEKAAGGAATRVEDLTTTSDLTPLSSSSGENGLDEPAPPQPISSSRIAPQRTVESDNSTEITPVATPDSSRPASPAPNHLLIAKAGPGKSSRRARKAAVTSAPSSRDVSTSKEKVPTKSTGKKMRKWGVEGIEDDGDDVVLDYSAGPNNAGVANEKSTFPESIDRDTFTTKTSRGEYMLKDLDDEMSTILQSAKSKDKETSNSSTGILGSSLNSISSMFRSVVGGKNLASEDLVEPMMAMKDHLINKNVAPSAATRLCSIVKEDLVKTKTATFQSTEAAVRAAMEYALTKMLAPTTNLDILRAVAAKKQAGTPYVISMVGVNGVGKSTTLAKLAFLLLNNNYRVLICAGDTFRSGAVEQLRVHVRNLKELTSRSQGLGSIDLFERGYGGDAANIARSAVAFASSPAGEEPYDVVLIDTAGRRHNDNSLMGSLEKFAQFAKPDKILMVGEALVGTDSVAQAENFNKSFGAGRNLDGFVISKCDTVGDMIGTLVSMVDATGAPVVALGVGQHYGDLRALNVAWAVRLLMS